MELRCATVGDLLVREDTLPIGGEFDILLLNRKWRKWRQE